VGVGDCRLIELPVAEGPLGDLAFAEGGRHVPFEIARAYYVYGVPAGARRGGHAHRTLHQAVFCLSGRLDVSVDDGSERRDFALEEPRTGLYLPPMVWRDLHGFAAGTIYMALASKAYDEDDYIRDHDEYLSAVGASS
jgi:hypothetical protein